MSFFQDVINIVAKYYPQLLSGVGNTMLIALTGTVAGLAIGLLTGIVRTAPFSRNGFVRVLHKILNAVIAVYVEIFRGTPMMVQAMVIYWGYAFLNDGATLPLIPAGLFIVSINTGAYMAEIVRGGIISVDRGQLEGAYSVGMTHAQAMAMGLRSGPTSRSKRATTWVVGMSDLTPLAFDSAEPDIRDTANAPDA